jgi:hypothetical protein
VFQKGGWIRRLVQNYPEVEADYRRRVGFYPAFHIVAVRRSFAAKRPDVVMTIYDALRGAFEVWTTKVKKFAEASPWAMRELEVTLRDFEGDIPPLGLEAPSLRKMVAAICTEPTLKTLKQLRHRGHDVIVFHVLDRDELSFPFERSTRFEDLETDDHLRARIWMTPESFSCAGPYGAYEYWAASANPNISDVNVWSDAAHAGQVYIYFLMEGGRLPTQAECDQVYAVCNADRIRPLTDQVFVQAPTATTSAGCVIKYWIKTADAQFANDIESKVSQAFADYLAWQKSKIGRDINPSKCDQMLVEAVAALTPGSDALGSATRSP